MLEARERKLRNLFLDINEIATGRRIYQGLISRTKKKALAPAQAAIAARTGRRKNGINKNEVYLISPAKIRTLYAFNFEGLNLLRFNLSKVEPLLGLTRWNARRVKATIVISL